MCGKCLELRKNPSFRHALSRRLPEASNFKHTPKHFIQTNPMHEIFRRSSSLANLYEVAENDPSSFWATFADAACKGSFDDTPVLEGLCQVMLQVHKREGKGLQNLRYSQEFTDFMVVLSSLSPLCAQLFQDNLAGCTLRSCLALRSKQDGLCYGFADSNFEALQHFLVQVKYEGPLAAASDCSILVQARRYDSKAGVLVGAVGGVHQVTSAEEVTDYVSTVKAQDKIAKYLRLYTLQVPLPSVPPYIAAALPASGCETAQELHELHLSFINKSRKYGVKIVSFGAWCFHRAKCTRIIL